MQIHLGLPAANGRLVHGTIAIGNFDGVHLGHRALFAAARARVSRRHPPGPVSALTFQPHPARLLAPAMAPPLICSLERKRELLAAAGVDALIEQPFDREFAALDPDAFVELLARTGCASVAVGADFTYGRGRSGNVDSLRRALEERGVELHILPQVTVEGLVVSSTKIREFVLSGRVDAATALLGRPYDLDGEVVRGVGRGKTLGWPTANIKNQAELLPAVGVYAVRLRLGQSEEADHGHSTAAGTEVFKPRRAWGPALGGAANLGINPTFRAAGAEPGPGALVLEVHLLDFAQDIYGRAVRVEFVQRLRDERRFPGVDALKAQIAKDVDEARALLSPRA